MPVQRICSTARGTGSDRSTARLSEAAALMSELISLRDALADITDRLHQVEVHAGERTRETARVLELVNPVVAKATKRGRVLPLRQWRTDRGWSQTGLMARTLSVRVELDTPRA
jgi:hypothetical protein